MAEQPTKTTKNLDREIISEFLANQKIQAQNEAQEIQLREKDLDNQANYAKDLLDKQHDLLKNKPRQDRFTIITIAVIIFVLLSSSCMFIGYLIHLGKDDLVKTILTWAGRITALLISFVLGRISVKKESSEDNNPDVEIMD